MRCRSSSNHACSGELTRYDTNASASVSEPVANRLDRSGVDLCLDGLERIANSTSGLVRITESDVVEHVRTHSVVVRESQPPQ